MADINVEMLKDRLYKVSKALFCIGEVCVDVSKQHISEEKAFNKIRGYLNDAGMYSRFEVDQIIEDCMEPIVCNVFEEKPDSWLEKAIKEQPHYFDRFVYYVDNIEDLKKHKANTNRIAEAEERMKKYEKKV